MSRGAANIAYDPGNDAVTDTCNDAVTNTFNDAVADTDKGAAADTGTTNTTDTCSTLADPVRASFSDSAATNELHVPSDSGDQQEASVSGDQQEARVTIEEDEKPFLYDLHENPNPLMTTWFALQQVLMSLSRSLSTSLLVADVVCARADEHYKAKLLSTTLFVSGVTTFLQNTLGVRLPLYQGPAAMYVLPLIAMSELPSWRCPDSAIDPVGDTTSNETNTDLQELIISRTQMLSGSLMIGGAVHVMFGLTGLVGVLVRFVGPITIIPTLTIIALSVYKATVKFAQSQFPISILTVGTAFILSFYMDKVDVPVPAWSRKRGLHIKRFPVQKMFSVLFACMVGWGVSGILTAAGAFSDDPTSSEFYARTDSRSHIIRDTGWFIIPYPGQFGPPGFNTGALVTFLVGTFASIIDSVGDYYACTKVCQVPPPPKHAINRGIVVEGLMSFLGGWAGAGHATSTFGGNIGAIGITKVASLRVFQAVGLVYIVFGVVAKVGAVFVTIPYSVVGGMMMINFGVLIGVMLSNLQFIDMNSTRNLAIIGIAMLMAKVVPHWLKVTPDAIATGSDMADRVLVMLLGNPAFVAAILACLLDNTLAGSRKERGLEAWQADLGLDDDGKDIVETQRLRNVRKTIYVVPGSRRLARCCPALKYLPFYPK